MYILQEILSEVDLEAMENGLSGQADLGGSQPQVAAAAPPSGTLAGTQNGAPPTGGQPNSNDACLSIVRR